MKEYQVNLPLAMLVKAESEQEAISKAFEYISNQKQLDANKLFWNADDFAKDMTAKEWRI